MDMNVRSLVCEWWSSFAFGFTAGVWNCAFGSILERTFEGYRLVVLCTIEFRGQRALRSKDSRLVVGWRNRLCDVMTSSDVSDRK